MVRSATAWSGAARRDAGALLEHHLRADERAQPGLLRRLVEPRRAVDAVAVDERDRREAALGGALDQVLGQRGAVEEREGGGGAQLDVGNRRFLRRTLPVALAQLFLHRAGCGAEGFCVEVPRWRAFVHGEPDQEC